MWVEAGDHAGDGVGDEFFLVHRLDIVAFDHAEDGGKLLQLVQGQRGEVAVAGRRLQRGRAKRASQRARAQPARDFEFLAHGGVGFSGGERGKGVQTGSRSRFSGLALAGDGGCGLFGSLRVAQVIVAQGFEIVI